MAKVGEGGDCRREWARHIGSKPPSPSGGYALRRPRCFSQITEHAANYIIINLHLVFLFTAKGFGSLRESAAGVGWVARVGGG